MLKDPELIPEYIIDLVEMSIDILEGEIYPKYMIQRVPSLLRKVVNALETRNEQMIKGSE